MDPTANVNDASRPVSSEASFHSDLTGQTLGDFKILHRIGQGGMGQVYLAEQISLKRKVALKLLKPELAANTVSLERFKAEALAVARATHANIVQVYAIGETAGLHYIALEYVEGRNLREYLEKKGPPEVLLGLSILRQTAAALQRAGELGIVHRDIKPDNILLTRKGEVKVADFGLSRIYASDVEAPLSQTQSGVTMGTPLYMSPEQVEGKRDLIDHRTDIYSLGVSAYHMFAGHPPFRGASPFEVAVQHVQKEAAPLAEIRPDLPADLCAIVHKMMAKKPDQRYQTAREVVREVSRLRDVIVGGSGVLPAPAVSLSLPSGFGDSGAQHSTTQKLPGPARALSSRGWFIALIPLALAGGLFLGWLVNHSDGPAQTPSNEPAEPGAQAKTSQAQKERERELIKRVQEYTRPGSLMDVMTGLNHSIELGLLYLRDQRLHVAEDFFKELEGDKQTAQYRMFGKLGRAMVLAFKDQPEESNKLFLQALDRERLDKIKAFNPVLRDMMGNPALREMMARALNHNHHNSPATFPKKLEPYRNPPPPTLRPAP